MKKAIIILLVILSISALAGNNKVDKTKEAQAKAWVKNQQLEFIENKGQFTTTEGKPADNVLFKTSFGSCDIYITDKGLSYVFIKFEEKEEKSITSRTYGNELRITKEKKTIGEREEEENKEIFYYRLDMDLVGASIIKENIIKEEESVQGHYNYFYPHCPEGIYDVKGYGKITIKNIYKGIDWIIYTNKNNKEQPLKYDFIVHPEANYKDIKIKYLNAQSQTLFDNDTKLKIQTIAGNIEEGNIYSYQNKYKEIQSKYILNNDSTITYEIGTYDKTKDLIIDPLVWATYYGGSGADYFSAICTDNQNNIIITGNVYSLDFPLLQVPGAYWQAFNIAGAYLDIVILKFNNHGVRLWATYYGGSGSDNSSSVSVDSHDNIYIAGFTESTNFPTQQLIGAYWQPVISNALGTLDIIILEFNNLGVRKWATYYGGDNNERAYTTCVDSKDNLYLSGFTQSLNFPTQQLAGAFWQANNASTSSHINIFVLKFNSLGVRKWATYYGGSRVEQVISMCTDSKDNIYLTGETGSADFPLQQAIGAYWQDTLGNMLGLNDMFILKFDSLGVRKWSTYYGGNSSDHGLGICVDKQNNLYVTGLTQSNNLPIHQLSGAYWQPNLSGATDLFICKFNQIGACVWSTYFGGNGNEGQYIPNTAIKSDKQNNIYITGHTQSTNFPTQQLPGEYWQPTFGGIGDIFLSKIDSSGVLKWSTYYGSTYGDDGYSLAIDKLNNVFIIGSSQNNNDYTIDPGYGAYYVDTSSGNLEGIILKISSCDNRKPDSLQSNKNNICINDNGTITLTAFGGKGDTLKWYTGGCGQNYIGKDTVLTIPSPTQTTTYYARWESYCDTSACDSIKIKVYPIFTTNLNKLICQGDTFHVGIHSYTSTGIYTDSLLTFKGCDSIIITNLKVNPIPQFNLGNDTTLCKGQSLLLDASKPNSTYLWQDGTTNPIYNVTHQGVYWLKVTTDSCSKRDTINVYYSPLNVNLGPDEMYCDGNVITLDATNSNSSYIWQDGSTNPKYKVNQAGTYWVTVTDLNNNHCIVSDTVNISYQDCETPGIFIPNCFTPNGDGLNDVFRIESVIVFKEFNLQIYNRWGELIFESSDINKGWNGRFKDKLVPDGVYVYLLNVIMINSEISKKFCGRVTVLR